MRSMPNGNKVTNFSLATNRVYKDANGNRQEQTEFHNIVVFGRQAETSAQYLKKGQGVMIEGRIQTRSWDDPNGAGKKYRTEIIADSVQFGPKTGGGNDDYASSNQASSQSQAPMQAAGELDTIDYGDANINIEDIPF